MPLGSVLSFDSDVAVDVRVFVVEVVELFGVCALATEEARGSGGVAGCGGGVVNHWPVVTLPSGLVWTNMHGIFGWICFSVRHSKCVNQEREGTSCHQPLGR